MNDVIKRISVDGVEYDIVANGVTKTTHAELKTLRDNAELMPGQWYRITDYEFTTVTSNTKSAGHVFDILVLAVDEKTLNHNAFAALHEGDEYFANVEIDAWRLLYDLDNDTDKYGWADAENGKGVIYRMIDDKRNDCPYDFKNVLFYNTKDIDSAGTTEDNYYYTFSYVVDGLLYDGTVEAQVKNCYGNSMGERRGSGKLILNDNVWRNSSFGNNCSSNTFGNNCGSNTFGTYCHSNTFGYNCSSNTFGYSCSSNTFGNYYSYNTFGNTCSSSTFGNSCSYNKFGNGCAYNTFGNNCTYNTFGNYCSSNTFGNSCSYNKFGNSCYYNTFGNSCNYNTFDNNCTSNTFEDDTDNRNIASSEVSITHADKYYEDGSGQLVPIKHPDLSTQPSILPYKFMGNYVYEQLIYVGEHSKGDSISHFLDVQGLATSNALILRCEGFVFGDCNLYNGSDYEPVGQSGVPLNLTVSTRSLGSAEYGYILSGSLSEYLWIPNTAFGFAGDSTVKVYARIVYTSVPEDSSYYGGY